MYQLKMELDDGQIVVTAPTCRQPEYAYASILKAFENGALRIRGRAVVSIERYEGEPETQNTYPQISLT